MVTGVPFPRIGAEESVRAAIGRRATRASGLAQRLRARR